MTRIFLNKRFYQIATMTLLLYIGSTYPLKLLEFDVAKFTLLGSKAAMSCLWKLDDEEMLYSVKWYKDGMEFFRYLPADKEPHKKFTIPGVDVLMHDSSGSNITLAPATLETEGRYRCEVSGERPRFLTVSNHSDMVIVALPSNGPFLSGIRSEYKISETVTGNCSSEPSRHATPLAWYINGVPAEATAIVNFSNYGHPDGFQYSILGLNLNLTNKYFTSKCVKIKCLSTIPSLYWKSNETCITVASNKTQIKVGTIRAEMKSYAYDSNSNGSNLILNFRCALCMFSISSLIINQILLQ